jgi:glycerate kinase
VGGIGFALMVYCQASMQSDFQIIAKLAGFPQLMKSIQTRPDIIITGEGCFDQQSLEGKVIGQLYHQTKAHHLPIIVLCGSIDKHLDLNNPLADQLSVFSIASDPLSLDQMITETPHLLENSISNIIKLLTYHRSIIQT